MAFIATSSGKTFRTLLYAEALACGLALVWAYMSIGVSVSNASGSIIRSAVLSPYAAGALMVLFYAFTLTFLRIAKDDWRLLKLFLIANTAVLVVTIPLTLYYNLYTGVLQNVSGKQYMVYPYAVQFAIPMLLSFYMMATEALVWIALRLRRRKTVFTLRIYDYRGKENKINEKRS